MHCGRVPVGERRDGMQRVPGRVVLPAWRECPNGCSEHGTCQGADRIFPGAGGAAVTGRLRTWLADGARLIISDTIRSSLLAKSVIKEANDAGIAVKLLEVDTPAVNLAE